MTFLFVFCFSQRIYWKAPEAALIAASAHSTSIWASAFCLSSLADPNRRWASANASWQAYFNHNDDQHFCRNNCSFTLVSRFSTRVASSANNCTLESGCTAIEPLLTEVNEISFFFLRDAFLFSYQKNVLYFHLFQKQTQHLV